jgi:hypothetical protein
MSEFRLSWKSSRQSERQVLSAAIELFSDHPHLLRFTFDQNEAKLRADPEALLQQAQSLSSGELLLVKLAMDLWNGSGEVRILELINGLDAHNFNRALGAIKSLGPQ